MKTLLHPAAKSKTKVEEWLGEDAKACWYSPGNKGACMFLQGGGESLEELKGVGGIGVGYGGGQQGLFQEEGVRAAT